MVDDDAQIDMNIHILALSNQTYIPFPFRTLDRP